MAVIATIFVSPPNSSITISTDSSSVISNYNKIFFFLSSSPSLNPIFKISHYPLWFFLFNLINSQHITLNFIKVKAHADDPLNNQVDQLAKLDEPKCLIKSSTFNNVIIPYFYDMPILLPTRSFIKELLRSQRFNNVIQLPHFAKYQSLNVDWNNTFRFINDNEAQSVTSFQASFTKKQRIKFLLEMLPVLEILKIRSPNLYQQNWTCCKCQIEFEDFNHIWTCILSHHSLCAIIETIKFELTQQLQALNTCNNTNALLQELFAASFWNPSYDPNNFCFIDLIKGIVPRYLFDSIQNITHNTMITTSLLSNIFYLIFTSASNIWTQRCDSFNKAEKLANITSHDKKHNWISNGFPHSPTSSSPTPSSFISSFRYGNDWSNFWTGSNQAPSSGWLSFLVV